MLFNVGRASDALDGNGIRQSMRTAGFGLLLADSGVNHQDEAQAIRDAVAMGAAGIIIFIQDGESYNAELLRLVAGGYPVVLVDRYLRGVRSAIASSDNAAGSRTVVRELLDAGHRHICVLTFPPRFTSTTEDRISGYIDALTDAGISVNYALHYLQSSNGLLDESFEPAPPVVENFAEFLRTHPEVTAIYANNALLALVAYRAAQRLQLRIPEDMSLACIDPLEALPLSLPAITCGVQQVELMGSTAVTLLQEVMAGKPPRTVLLPMALRRAGSIAPPARGGEAANPLPAPASPARD